MPIPKILHFCFGFSPTFGDKPWSLVHHVSVASAISHIRPEVAYLYYEYEPCGPWWDLSKKLLTPVPMIAPREVYGNPVTHPAHQADVVRIQKLLEMGGIYLDADVLVHRSFDPLLSYQTVMGYEGVGDAAGLANAVILAEPNAEFLQFWHDTYRQFRSKGRDIYWNEHSVKVPAILAQRHPDLITTLPHTAFFCPLWHRDHLKMIYGENGPNIVGADTYATHLWETHAWSYLENLTPGHVRRSESNFCRLARPYVDELYDDYGAPSAADRMALLYRKPRRLIRTVSQKIKRGGTVILQGRRSPTI